MTTEQRPYMWSRVDQLEDLVKQAKGDEDIYRAVLYELSFRKTKRANDLKRYLQTEIMPGLIKRQPESAPSAPQVSAWQQKPVPPPPIEAVPLPQRTLVENRPQDILDAWTVFEVLSPSAYKKPADLAAGDVRNVVRFDRGLPWAGGAAKGPPHKRLYFQIVLGAVEMQPAMERLLQRFSDSRPEKPRVRGETPLAVVIVDREGRPLADEGVVLSSFGWGLPLALRDDPARLRDWPAQETALQKALCDRLCREDENGDLEPLSMEAITAAYEWLVETLGLEAGFLKPPFFAIRSTVSYTSKEPPAALLLNSFFLGDLAKARAALVQGEVPQTVQRFLGPLVPPQRRDLLQDEQAVEESLAPRRFPLGR